MKPVFIALVVLAGALSGFCDMRFTATTDHTNVATGEQVVVIAELTSDRQLRIAGVPPIQSGDAFDLIHTEQNQSSSSQIEITNGRTIQKNEIKYQFYYSIVPKKAGTFVFPSIKVTVEKTPYATDPITFTVSGDGAKSQASGAGGEPVKNADVRILLTLGKQSLFVGEQTILTFKVAQRNNSPTQVDRGFNEAVTSLDKSFGKDFSLTRLFSNQVSAGSERIGGEMYHTYTLRWAVIPVTPGTFTIPSIPYEYAELRRARNRGNDPFFDDFFGGGVQAEGRVANSNQLVIRVKDVPPPPADYSGAVGRFRLSASIDPQTVPAGEAATLKIQVNAETRPGNVADITVPKIADCEIFAPEKHVSVDTTAAGIVTAKTFKYLLIPQQAGNLALPPIEVSYFDPSEGVFKKATSGPLSLMVTPGKGGSKPQTRYLTQEEIREVGTDIRYIKTGVKIRNVNDKPYRDPIFFLLYPLPFALFLFALLYRAQSQRREANAALYVRRRALRSAHKALDQVQKLGAKVPAPEFLSKVAETLERYISQKFGFAATGRTLDELKHELLGRNADERIVSDLAKFIELLDGYRFGGVSFDEKSRAAVIDQAADFLANLEKSVKKGKKTMSAPASLIAIIGVVCCCALSTYAAPVGLWFDQANRFYTQQDYDSAVTYYEKIVGSGTSSSVVYFNLGNAYFRLKKLGLARLCYEKAARLDPADQDVATNCKFVASNIVDRAAAEQRGFVETALYRLHILMPLRVQLWFCFSLLLAISLLVTAALYVSRNQRLWLIYLSTLLAIVLIFSGLSMGIKIYASEKSAYAILLEQSVDAKNGPDGGKVLFTAHEGTKFQIRKTVDAWSLVSLPNGVSGWVENKVLGRI
jgi:tetratricopeptide (TPR) repeat protein